MELFLFLEIILCYSKCIVTQNNNLSSKRKTAFACTKSLWRTAYINNGKYHFFSKNKYLVMVNLYRISQKNLSVFNNKDFELRFTSAKPRAFTSL